MIENILLKTALTNKNTYSFALSPTLEQARKLYGDIMKAIGSTRLHHKHNDMRLMIELVNGSIIMFKSAEQKEALRGYTCTGILLIDEAYYIPDEAFYTVLPWCNVSKAPIVLVSTPKYKVGFFYKYYMMGWSNEYMNVFSYNWSDYDTSALLSSELLEQYRKTLPINQFKSEYLGEWLDNESGVFGNFDNVLSDKYDEGLNLYMGIDFGTNANADETSITIFNSSYQMVAIYHFNDKDETETVDFIIDLIKEYKPLKVLCELQSIGNIFYGLIKKRLAAIKSNTMLMGFNTTNESKRRLVNQFQVAIQNKTVQLLNDSALVTELMMYEMKLSPTGKPTYNAANGYKDDMIMSTLIAYECVKRNPGSVYFT